MSLLSSWFKSSKKTNLTPDFGYQTPQQASPQAYGDLATLSHNYLNGVGVGYGSDYVDKNVNPVASSMRRNFQNVTSPFISGQYSSRGLGRSSLAGTSQGLAEGNVESDIGNLMAQFYNLNEVQKKSDTQFGAQVGQNLLGRDVGQSNQKAAASERLANATNADAMNRQSVDNQKMQQFGQAASSLVAPILGNFMPGSTAMPMVNAGGQNYQTSTYGAGNVPTGMPQPSSNVQMLGQVNNNSSQAQIAQILKQMFGI